ncbi:MAG: hypothetical protein ACTSR3_12100 [Candidatus Helarchaeota archaeon]
MVIEIKIDLTNCSCCKTCIKKCLYGVLEWFEDRPVVVNPSACSICFKCKENCQFGAINVKER